MSFTIQQPKRKGHKSGTTLVFIDSVHFQNYSSDNLRKNLGENDLDHLSQESNANVIDLRKKRGFSLL